MVSANKSGLKGSRNDLGAPDWRDENAYPGEDELTNDEWRWEFLRRRNDYREDFARPDESYIEESKGRYFERVYFMGNLADPTRSVKAMKTKKPDTSDPFSNLFQATFDITFLDTDLRALYGDPFTGELPRGEAQPYHLDLRVDLTHPLPPQFLRLYRLAEDAQAGWKRSLRLPRRSKWPLRRPHRGKWPLYLRVLDARDARAKLREIGEVVLSYTDYDEAAKRAAETHKAARRLQEDFPKFCDE